jgi:hypothetical protein
MFLTCSSYRYTYNDIQTGVCIVVLRTKPDFRLRVSRVSVTVQRPIIEKGKALIPEKVFHGKFIVVDYMVGGLLPRLLLLLPTTTRMVGEVR